MDCPNCSTPHPEAARFCSRCGTLCIPPFRGPGTSLPTPKNRCVRWRW
ncbi:zinc-ribbon domain-containing protein [Mycobacterium liflandii]|nr:MULTISPECIES: zinc-ribbon domain-containing protein [Mycobacterium ulcerans group]